jgi:hypothetical protein
MKYETPSLEVLLVEEELFMALSVNDSGDAGDDDSLDFGDNW